MENSSRAFLLFAFLFVILCSAILPVLSLQYNSIGISSHGTVNTQAVQSSINALYCNIHDLEAGGTTFLNRIKNGKFTFIYLSTAYWDGNNNLNMLRPDADFANFFSQVKTAVPSIKILSWLWSWESYGIPDIRTAAQRTAMVNKEVALMQRSFGGYHFDGTSEDTEVFVGQNWNDQLLWYNELGTAFKNVGKICTAGSIDSNWAYLNTLTYQCQGFNDPDNYAQCTTDFEYGCAVSPEPVIFNIGYMTLIDHMNWIDGWIAANGMGAYPKLAGFGVYWYPEMTDAEWTAWINWATKG